MIIVIVIITLIFILAVIMIMTTILMDGQTYPKRFLPEPFEAY